jgi:tRNA pseudouridine38-40 synthase
MVRLKLTIQYDGGAYYGWQIQDGLPTVQGKLAEALEKIVGHAVEIQGAGRTDRGVHAWGQIAHADVKKDLDIIKYIGGMNRFLPEDIRVVDAEKVTGEFHARFSGKARHYVYRLWNGRQLRPDLVGHAGHVILPLDMQAMREAVAMMPLGENDFAGYQDAECQSKVSLCDLMYMRWVEEAPALWRLEIAANHFLHHMVRNIVGTLVEIGLGKRPVTGLVDVLNAGDRVMAGATFEADGLYLTQVVY